MKVMIVVSGGMDSVTLLHFIKKQVHPHDEVIPVTFDYGQKHSKEIACAKAQCLFADVGYPQIIDMTFLGKVYGDASALTGSVAVPNVKAVLGDPQPITYVPNRNMIFLAIAAGIAEAKGANLVYYGAQRHDIYGYWDTTPQFLDAVNQMLNLNRRNPIRIMAPFINFSKAQVLATGLELGVNYDVTWSCYNGGSVACGTCPTCAERLMAFELNGLEDPLIYEPGIPKRKMTPEEIALNGL